MATQESSLRVSPSRRTFWQRLRQIFRGAGSALEIFPPPLKPKFPETYSGPVKLGARPVVGHSSAYSATVRLAKVYRVQRLSEAGLHSDWEEVSRDLDEAFKELQVEIKALTHG